MNWTTNEDSKYTKPTITSWGWILYCWCCRYCCTFLCSWTKDETIKGTLSSKRKKEDEMAKNQYQRSRRSYSDPAESWSLASSTSLSSATVTCFLSSSFIFHSASLCSFSFLSSSFELELDWPESTAFPILGIPPSKLLSSSLGTLHAWLLPSPFFRLVPFEVACCECSSSKQILICQTCEAQSIYFPRPPKQLL